MLLWQLKNVRNRHVLWLKLLACSFAAHLLFVGIFFFGYRDGVSSHKFTMHSHNPNRQVTVVLAPTVHKSVANGAPVKQTTLAQNIKPAQHNKAATRVATLKPTPPKVIPKKAVPAKKVATKIAPVKTVAAKKAPVKTVPAKIVQTKIEKPKIVQSKPVPEQKKPAVAKAPEVVSKVVEKKVEQPKELAEQKKLIEAPLALAQPAVAKAMADKPDVATQSEQVVAQEQNNMSTHIEVPYTQAREFYQQEALRKELSRHWKPPHGISDTCTCEITTYVGNNGVVTDSVITQSSGILMYDVSARAAILAMDLPRWTWGNSFAITFKP